MGLVCQDNQVRGIELCKLDMSLVVGYAIHFSDKLLCQGGQNITGTLPTEIARLPFVQWISLAWNALTGTLPVEYAGMKHLLNLEVHGNNLVGTIPIEYWSANGLQQFNVGENLMSGTLSSEVGLLTNLRGFFLLDNMFTGTFPTEIGNLAFLGAFLLRDKQQVCCRGLPKVQYPSRIAAIPTNQLTVNRLHSSKTDRIFHRNWAVSSVWKNCGCMPTPSLEPFPQRWAISTALSVSQERSLICTWHH